MRPYFASLIVATVLLATSAYTFAHGAFYLGATPSQSDCTGLNLTACRALDAVEESGYAMARRGNMTWVRMVDRFYEERGRYFPNMRDDHFTAEIRAYQRVLAERKDAGKITESEWVFLLAKQFSVLTARDNQSQSARQQEQHMQQLRNDQANYEQQQRNMEHQQQMQQQQIDQQRMQQQQMEQQQNWQRMQQR